MTPHRYKRAECWDTHALKERGWTPAMIRDLLGPHDRERDNDLRVGRSNRRVDAPVKLYAQERVLAAEATEKFAALQERAREAQNRASTAAATHKAKAEAAVDALIEQYSPIVTRLSDEDLEAQYPGPHRKTALWNHVWLEMWRVKRDAPDDLRLTHAQRRRLDEALREKELAAFHAAYPEFAPETN